MSGVGDVIGGFYSKFILRDFLSILMPGAIVVISYIYYWGIIPDVASFFETFSYVGYLLIFGLFYVVGFICLTLFEFIFYKFLRKYTRDTDEEKDDTKETSMIRIFFKNFNKENSKIYDKQLTFFEKIECHKERGLRIYERELIFYQTCGALFTALLLISPVVYKQNIIGLIICLIAVLILIFGSIIHFERAEQWRDEYNRWIAGKGFTYFKN